MLTLVGGWAEMTDLIDICHHLKLPLVGGQLCHAIMRGGEGEGK